MTVLTKIVLPPDYLICAFLRHITVSNMWFLLFAASNALWSETGHDGWRIIFSETALSEDRTDDGAILSAVCSLSIFNNSNQTCCLRQRARPNNCTYFFDFLLQNAWVSRPLHHSLLPVLLVKLSRSSCALWKRFCLDLVIRTLYLELHYFVYVHHIITDFWTYIWTDYL